MAARMVRWGGATRLPRSVAALGAATTAAAVAVGFQPKAQAESIAAMLENINSKLEKLEAVAATRGSKIKDPVGKERLYASVGYNRTLIADRQAVYESIKSTEAIPELGYTPTRTYVEASKEEILYPMIEENSVLLVPGAYFGDEGKGKTVAAIAEHPAVQVVARVNSGENAGHTVYGLTPAGIMTKFAFNLCPSGLLTPGKVNVVGPECVMDPVSFMTKEISQLTKAGVPYKDRLFVGDVHIVCPHHKLLDLMGSWSAPNKSTLMGMGPVHASKAARKGLRLDHLFNDRADAKKRIEQDMVLYFGMMKQLGITEEQLYDKAKSNPKIQPHVLAFITAPDKGDYVLDLYQKWVVENPEFPQRRDISHMLREVVSGGGKVLLEGPQSFWLSNSAEKFWDSGTSASTGTPGMLSASRINPTNLKSISINIHKTPGSSRVGGGASACSFVPQNYFSTTGGTKDDFDEMKLDWRDVSEAYFKSVQPNGIVKPGLYTNETGTYDLGVAMACATCIHPTHQEFGVTSGRPRVVGFFDCVMQAELIACQGPYCSISAFDRGDDYDSYGVCIAYIYQHPQGKSMISNGKTYESGSIIKAGDALPTQSILEYCHPIIKMVEGWRDTPLYQRSEYWQSRAGKGLPLPKPVCDLIDIIEHFTGTQVISIGNGPRGTDIIYIKRS